MYFNDWCIVVVGFFSGDNLIVLEDWVSDIVFWLVGVVDEFFFSFFVVVDD